MPTKDNESSSSNNEYYSDEKPIHKYGKPVNVSEQLNMDSETESKSSYGGTAYASTKHHAYNYDLTHFDKTTVLSLQNIHFHSNVIKLVLGFIPKFENFISEWKIQMDKNPSSPKWAFQ